MQYSIASRDDGVSCITIVADGEVHTAFSDHVNYDKIVQGALTDDYSVIGLFDLSEQVAEKFNGLSERIAVANGQVYFDGDVVDNVLTQEIVKFLHADQFDWIPLVKFMDKVQQNPNDHSREQLFAWLREYDDFVITPEGDFIAYKGLASDMTSIYSGTAIVNGQKVTGKIPNQVGSVIEMPRSQVVHDPGHGCSVGLHCATHTFAQGWGESGNVVSLEVNPRDVVSVPTGATTAEKMRVCRYKVKELVTGQYSGVVTPDAQESYAGTEYEDPYDDEELDW